MAYGKSCETLILRNSNPWINRPDVPISPQQAGITYPDPSYEIRRDRSMPFYDFVYVFEYVTKGKGYIECNGRKYTVRAGDFYFLNRRIEPHYYPDPADPYEKIWANIGGTFLNMMTEAYHINMPVLVCRGLDEMQNMQRIHDILRSIQAHGTRDDEAKLMHVLIDIFRDMDNYLCQQAQDDSLLERICRYIDRNLAFPISVDSIAQNFYISRSTLFRLFKANYGLSPKTYILKKKTELSCEMLRYQNTGIEEIAATLHFSDAKHFSSTFKRFMNLTPAAYRTKQDGEAQNITPGKDISQ